MSLKDKEKWNHKYEVPDYITGKEPVKWLSDNSGMLAGKGYALDIASGEGRNAVFVAEKGYKALAVDISNNGLKKAHTLADEKGVAIETCLVDLDSWEIRQNAFDLILCFNFLDRKIFSSMKNALKPGGLIFYETFTVDYLKYSNFKREWVLEHNELLDAFSELRILSYREVDTNDKAFASLIALK
jgi:tellurite methyltransferase